MVLEHLAILVVVSKASKVFWSISNLILAVPLLQPDRVEVPLELVDLQEAVDRRRYRQTACEHRSQRGSGTAAAHCTMLWLLLYSVGPPTELWSDETVGRRHRVCRRLTVNGEGGGGGGVVVRRKRNPRFV